MTWTRRSAVGLTLLAFILPASAGADSVMKVAGKVLQIGVGPRAVGMGEAQSAVADDAYSLYWNPAGLGRLRQTQVSFMHNVWFGGITSEFLGYAQSFGTDGFGISLNYTSYGEFEKYGIDSNDYPVPLDSNFTPFSLVTTAGYAHWITSTVSVGGALKLISEGVDTYNNLTMALDAGLQVPKALPGLDLGLTLHNIGLPLEGYSLPMSVRAGAAYHVPLLINEQKDQFLLALDANLPVPLDQPFYTNLGLEYWYDNTVAFRGGYRVSQINSLGSAAGLTAGVGLRVTDYTLDYAFSSFGELGMTHRVAFTAGFGEPKKAKRTKRAAGKAPVTSPGVQEGAVLVPKISGLSLRAPVTVSVTGVLLASDPTKTKLQSAAFDVQVDPDAEVDDWSLSILDAQRRVLRKYSSQGNPGALTWNGRDEQGRQPAESVFATYEFAYTLKDGSSERLTGRLYTAEREDTVPAEGQSGPAKINPIYFDEGMYDLSPAAIQALKDAAQAIKSKPYTRVMVDGYADGGTEKGQEFLLSQRRADAVARYLTVNHKIPLTVITLHARGSKNAVASNQTADGRAQNRRVEITVVAAR
jgi:outer membrane protein OmpA-like peptidoglycan-associated protein